MNNQPYVVLMAEDDKHDIVAAKRAWKQNHIKNSLQIVNDGEECLDYLYQRGKFSAAGSAPRAGILLLDVNMPRMDGLTVLQHIREDERLRRLPVIVLTTSDLEEDRLRSYDLGANAFVRKPVGFENFSKTLQTTNLFWELAELPE